MIEKVISIKNVGRFRNCNPIGDVSFRKTTLLFAENGRGKTTLCSILRSLKTGQSEFITERRTLGASDAISVQLRLSGNNYTFRTDSWTSTYPNITIFDSVFVHSNVYEGDHVDHEHKKNLYRVIVGPQGVQLAREIEALDSKIRTANINIREKKELLTKTLPDGMPIEDYLNWEPIDDIDVRIQNNKEDISIRKRTLEKVTEIRSKSFLSKISFPVFPSEFLEVLLKQLTDVVADAESRVSQQIKDHHMGSQGETWLSQGLDFVTDDKCPFCGQYITANELITAYRSHFNAAYSHLKQEVAQLSKQITDAVGERSLNTLQQSLSNNSVLLEFWKQFTEVSLPSIDFHDVLTKYSTLRDIALELAQRKQQSPTELITPGEDFQAALLAVTSLQSSVDVYNTAIDTVNMLIKEQKDVAQQGPDISSLEIKLANLEARKKRFAPEVVQTCKDYQEAVNEKTALEQQKASTREQLDRHSQQILQTYQDSINTFLDQFNAGFRITNSRHLYSGGTPSSHYQIEINNNVVELGDSRTQPGTPCFKTTLSSGDRSALAFAFFLAILKQDAGIGNKIVVFDDPFTSQDRFRRTCTQQLIRQIADMAQQVIVLSHDPYFLKLIWDGYPAEEIKTLQMYRTGDNTIIGEWDIKAETQSTYLQNYDTLLNYYRERKGRPLDVGRAIRPFIEGMLRSHFPGHFQQNEWLGDFINKIRNSADGEGLVHAKVDLMEIEAINDYSKKYHHDQNPNADSEILSEDELHGIVRRTLKLVGGC